MNVTPPALRPSDGAVAASIVLGIVIGLIWVLHLATVASLGRSDAAGNGIAEAYAAIQIIALWLLLTIMTVIAGAKGRRQNLPWSRRSSWFRFPASSP
jgi:hypothetical protein